MEQRLSLVTLGVNDLSRARAFYEDGLGWIRANADDEVAFYQLGGMVLALFARAALAEDAGVPAQGSGFSGVALAYNVRARADVARALDEAVAAGGSLVKAAADTVWGGHAGYFADPDGHLWEIAWNPFWRMDANGAVSLKG